MKCPDCEGGIVIAGHVRYADGTGAFGVPITCLRCRGTTTVSDNTVDWVARGKVLSQMMRDKGMTLRQGAECMKVGVVELSRARMGYEDPGPFIGLMETMEAVKNWRPQQ